MTIRDPHAQAVLTIAVAAAAGDLVAQPLPDFRRK
jgi:hypothetical protein